MNEQAAMSRDDSRISVPADGPADRKAPERVAIVLFNLGGPDGPDSIRKFRVNLFSDPAIIRAPVFVRFWLARLIASSSQKKAEEGYALIGGRSPLLDLTTRQAEALESRIPEAKCFIAMRYWHPFASEVARQVKAYAPNRILLLPLYPQFSTTTTGSSLVDWHDAAARAGLAAETTTICCWFDDRDFARAQARLIAETIRAAREEQPDDQRLRLLFSAHGLPESIVLKGDPYQEEIERTTEAVMAELGRMDVGTVEHQVCYQSRATPERWLSPSTEQAIEKAAEDKVAAIVVPIAFVSEHIETLVELDVEYRDLAKKLNLPGYYRVPAPNNADDFIDALAGIARRAVGHGPGLCSHRGGRACEARHGNCPWSRYRARVPA